MSQDAFFVAGGTVPPGSPSYVERAADRELLDALLAGEFCFVLNSRQMGKSSLAVRTIARLNESGVRTAFVDLTRLGATGADPERWYAGLLAETGRALGLRAEAMAYLKANAALPPVARLFGFLRDVALSEPPLPSGGEGAGGEGSIVLLIDEIDAVRSLPFPADDLFAGLRELHNARATDPTLRRLIVCLLGAALPSDLIADPRRTPFNVGRRIELRDFTPEEARPFASALLPLGGGQGGGEILARVLHWTGGHPFLTQALCAGLAGNPPSGEGPGVRGKVDALVRARYLDARARDSDTNLADVGNRLLGSGDPSVTDEDRAATLTLYERVLRGKDVPDDEANPAAARVKMSGVARVQDGGLRVRNRIYAAAFDARWIKEVMPGGELRRQRRAFWRGALRTGLVSTAVLAVVSSLAVVAVQNAHAADRSAREEKRARVRADAQTEIARKAQRDALDQKSAAEDARTAAQTQRDAATKARDLATQAEKRATKSAADLKVALTEQQTLRGEADAAARDADHQRDLALTQKGIAQDNAAEAKRQKVEAQTQTRLVAAERDSLERDVYENAIGSLSTLWDKGNRPEVTAVVASESRHRERGWEWGYWNRISKAEFDVLDPSPPGKNLGLSRGTVFPSTQGPDYVLYRYSEKGCAAWRIDGATGRPLALLWKVAGVEGARFSESALSHDQRWAVHRDEAGRLVRQDLQSGALVPLPPTDEFLFPFMSDDGGRYLTYARRPDSIQAAAFTVWDVAAHQPLATHAVVPPFSGVLGLCPSPRTVLLGYQDDARRVQGVAEYDFVAGKMTTAYTTPIEGGKADDNWSPSALWTAAGELVVYGPKKIAVFRAGDPRPRLVLASDLPYARLSASTDGRWLMASSDGLDGTNPLNSAFWFSKDSGRSEVWDLRSGTLAARLPQSGLLVDEGRLFLHAHDYSIAGTDWRKAKPYRQTQPHKSGDMTFGEIWSSDSPTLAEKGDTIVSAVLRQKLIKGGGSEDWVGSISTFDARGTFRGRVPSTGEFPKGQVDLSNVQAPYVQDPFWVVPRGTGTFDVRRLPDLRLVRTVIGTGSKKLEVSGDGRLEAWIDGKHVLRVRTIANGRVRSAPIVVPKAKGECGLRSFSPDGTKILGDDDASWFVWDARTLNLIARYEGPEVIGWSPSGRELLTRPDKGGLGIYDVATKTERRIEPDRVGAVAVSSDGRLVAYAVGNVVEIASFRTGHRLFSLDTDRPDRVQDNKNDSWGLFISSVAFSLDGHRLLVLYSDGQLRVFSDDHG